MKQTKLKSSKKILVTCYVKPDLDGTACAISYAEYLNKNNQPAQFGIYGTPTVEARFILDFLDLKISNANEPFDDVVLTDASTINGLPKNLISPDQVTEIIDHRQNTELHHFKNLKIAQIELVGAAATLVAEKFQKSKTEISRGSAILLHQAIISNTLNFQANVTTIRDKKAAAFLSEQTNIPSELTREMFKIKSDMTGNKLAENIEGDIARVFVGKYSFLIGQLEMMGVEKLVEDRKSEIVEIMENERIKREMDKSFISLIDLESGKNTFICNDPEIQDVLEEVIHIKFADDVAILNGLIMRKEITPLLKNYYGVK